MLQFFCQHAQTDAVMPKQLDQSSAASTEGVDCAAERIVGQPLLHQHGEAYHALPHVRNPTGQIDPRPRRQRDHRAASAASTRRRAWPSTRESTRSVTFWGSRISIRPGGRWTGTSGAGSAVEVAGSGSCLSECVGAISTRAKPGGDCCKSVIWPPITFCRQPYSSPLLMPCLRATSVGVSVDPRLSATISRFCSTVQTRRRSPRVITSTRAIRAPLRLIVCASSAGSGSGTIIGVASMADFHHSEITRRKVSPPKRLRIYRPARLGTPVGIGGNKPPRSPVLSIRPKHLIHPPHRIGDLKMKYLILAAFAALPAAIAPVANAASTIAGHAQATRL